MSDSRDNWKVYLLPGSDDANKIEVTRKAASQSLLIADMLADDDDDSSVPEIPLLEVTLPVLEKVVQFLNQHKDNPMKTIVKPIQTNELSEIVDEWDAQFMQLDNDLEMLFKIILAANYLNIPSLLDLGICKIATMVKGKEPDEVKDLFNIEKDITPEEEKLVREQNPWIFEINSTNTTTG